MAPKKARKEMNQKHGRRIVNQRLRIWGTLNKAVVQDTSISNTAMTAQFPPINAWRILIGKVEDESSSLANEHALKNIETLVMMKDLARESIARAKGLASAAEYDGVEVVDEEICRQILNVAFPSVYIELCLLKTSVFGLGIHSLSLGNVEGLKKQRDISDGHALAVGFRTRSGQRGRSGGRNNGVYGRHDGRGRQHQQQPLSPPKYYSQQ